MANVQKRRPRPGSKVTLIGLPPGFLDDLPEEDRKAIRGMVGKPILLREYDEDGRAVLEFIERNGTMHDIYVGPKFIRQVE